jgi:integrase
MSKFKSTPKPIPPQGRTLDPPDRAQPTVLECLDAYERRCERDGITSTAIPSVFRNLRAQFEHATVSKLSTRDVESMMAALKEEGYAPGSVQAHVAYLRAAMRYAHKKGELSSLPYFPVIKVENTRTGFFEREEFERVVAYLPDPHADIARFGYATGWRLSEILGLQWSDVNREQGVVTIQHTKNGHGRILPLVGERAEIIERRWTARGVGDHLSEWVFHRNGRRITRTRYWERWQLACAEAHVKGRLFHDLRRTAARDMIAAGCDYQTAMAVTGHRSMSMFLRYQIVDLRNVTQGLQALDAHRNRRH